MQCYINIVFIVLMIQDGGFFCNKCECYMQINIFSLLNICGCMGIILELGYMQVIINNWEFNLFGGVKGNVVREQWKWMCYFDGLCL